MSEKREKRVLVLMGSPRKEGNTSRLTRQFVKGAREAGHRVDQLDLRDLHLHPCLGCCACQHNGGFCIQHDDMDLVYGLWLDADVVVLASPVYFYGWTALMKEVLDRTFAIEKKVKDTSFILLTCGAAPEESFFELIVKSFEKYVGCFRAGGNQVSRILIGAGTNNPGDVEGQEVLSQAYQCGLDL